jgi:uncharacterized protein (DUF305 family)
MKTMLYAALILVVAATVPAIAQQSAPHAQVPPMMYQPDSDASPSSQAFRAADQKMMHTMMVPMSGNADRDFVAGMIPHHQGAVDMAKVELKYGTDPEMRRLATNIINSQARQIAQMDAWQAKHAAH